MDRDIHAEPLFSQGLVDPVLVDVRDGGIKGRPKGFVTRPQGDIGRAQPEYTASEGGTGKNQRTRRVGIDHRLERRHIGYSEVEAPGCQLQAELFEEGYSEVELREGRYRQIRRMLEGVGLDCLRLVRIAVDTLLLGDLQKGDSRPLTSSEIASLRKRVASNNRFGMSHHDAKPVFAANLISGNSNFD